MKRTSGRIQPGVAVILACIALFILLVNSRGCWNFGPNMHFDRGWLNFPFFGVLGFSGLIQIGLAAWVGVDAQRRGSNGYLWGLLVFFTPLIGLIVYLLWAGDVLERVSERVQASSTTSEPEPVVDVTASTAVDCGLCGERIEREFKVCPSCGAAQRCPGCDKGIQQNWKLCPWCATKLPRPSES